MSEAAESLLCFALVYLLPASLILGHFAIRVVKDIRRLKRSNAEVGDVTVGDLVSGLFLGLLPFANLFTVFLYVCRITDEHSNTPLLSKIRKDNVKLLPGKHNIVCSILYCAVCNS